jgi:hypothetical protein
LTQVLLQTGRLKIAQCLPHAALFARELVNFRFKVTSKGPEYALDWREGPDDDLVLALAIAAWEAERNPGPSDSRSRRRRDGGGSKGRASSEIAELREAPAFH